jgi:protein-L-isoaspartate(D-aspartate) O-methyltransferase
MLNFTNLRWDMVREQVLARGVRDQEVLGAMRRVPRHAFVPEHLRSHAYEDRPLPIAEGLVLDPPSVIAWRLEALALTGREKVLLIGAGTGYEAALLAELGAQVFAIEPDGPTAERAAGALVDLGVGNVRVLHDDGLRGWSREAPFDAIMVASARLPGWPEALREQLVTGGRMVRPAAEGPGRKLIRTTRAPQGRFRQEELAGPGMIGTLAAGDRRDSASGSRPA